MKLKNAKTNKTIYRTPTGYLKHVSIMFIHDESESCVKYDEKQNFVAENNIIRITKAFSLNEKGVFLIVKSRVYNCDEKGLFLDERPYYSSHHMNMILDEIETLKDFYIKKYING